MTIRVNWRSSVRLTGMVLRWLAVPLSFPLLIAIYYGEPITPFVVAIAVTLVLGVGLKQLTDEHSLGPREAFLMVAMTWFSVAVVGAIPFVVAGRGTIAYPINALFESMSGVTTTGATVLRDFEIHTRSILMWRQVEQWLGGLGILVLATAVLSQLSVGGARLMETETQYQNVNKLTPRISQTAQIIWKLYVGLTVLQITVLYSLHRAGFAPEMGLYNAVAHAFTSIATAGFSPEAGSIRTFEPIVQWVIVPFMILGSTSFILIYFVIQGDFDRLRTSEEFHFYLGTLAFFSLVVATLLFLEPDTTPGIEATFRHAVFNAISMITTTGYASTDFAQWSASAQHMLFLAMFLGGMAGSTTCSIKSFRWLVVLKSFRRDLFTASHPEVVSPVRLSGGVVDEDTIRDVYAYTLISIVIFFLFTVFIVVDAARTGIPLSEFEAMGAAASTFLNIGPAFGFAGPFGTYERFPESTKVVIILLMWIGRIEIFPVLVLLTPSFWRS